MPTPTRLISGTELREGINAAIPGAVQEATESWVRIVPAKLVDVARYVHDEREIDARFLNAVSGVDRYDHFEVVYHLTSLAHNHAFVLKVRADHDAPEVPSVATIWQGAHLQEREIFDLLGIRFEGHTNLKRLFLWEGFPGYPLRKDFMALPGGVSPGLRRFPNEDPEQWGGEARAD